MTDTSGRDTVAAVWRIESARIVGALARYTGDFALAEDLAPIADNVVQHGAQILSGPCPNEGPDGGTILTIREPQGGILRFVHDDRQHPTGEVITDRPFRRIVNLTELVERQSSGRAKASD